MPKTKVPAPKTGEIDIFARGEIASKLKAATTKGAVRAVEAPEASNPVTLVPEPVKIQKAPSGAEKSPERSALKSPVTEKSTPVINKIKPLPATESKNIPLRFRVSTELKGEWTNFMSDLSSALGGVSLDDSNLGRPLLETLLVEYRDQVIEQAKEIQGTLKRPALSDRMAMAEFDEEIRKMLSKALRQRRKKTSLQ